jgi:hypothetical protein
LHHKTIVPISNGSSLEVDLERSQQALSGCKLIKNAMPKARRLD